MGLNRTYLRRYCHFPHQGYFGLTPGLLWPHHRKDDGTSPSLLLQQANPPTVKEEDGGDTRRSLSHFCLPHLTYFTLPCGNGITIY